MGNRAVLSFGTAVQAPAIYLHWNGGRASVEGILEACKETKCTAGLRGAALADRVAAVAVGFIGSSVYRGRADQCDCDNGDNGLYIIGQNLAITGRLYADPAREEIDAEKTAGIRDTCREVINDAQSPEILGRRSWAALAELVQQN